MGSYSGSCEIVEAREGPRSVRNDRGAYQSHPGSSLGGRDRQPHLLKIGHKDSPEDDINQLFEAITLKNSKGQGLSSPVGSSAGSLRRNAMKRPITVSGSHSSGFGNSEQVSLKQALRDLCISKASEMAAMKRLSLSINSPRISEAERIKSLYNSVVVETSRSSPSVGNSKGTMVEISLAPEESKISSSHKMPKEYLVPRVKSSSQSAHSSPRFQGLKSPNQSAISSPRFGVPVVEDATKITSVPNESVCSSRRLESQILRSPNQSSLSSTRSVAPKTKNDNASTSTKVGSRTLKTEIEKKEKPIPAAELTCSNSIDNAPDPDMDKPTMPKKASKASVPRSGRKGRLHAAPASSANGNRVSKVTRSTPRIKQPIRNKTFVKKKVKQVTVGTSRISNGSNRSLVPGTGRLVCQKCQCALKNPTEYSNQDFLGSSSANLSAEVSSISVNSDVHRPEFISNTCNETGDVGKATNTKSRKKEEFSQSSKSSEFSTSTSNSDESNASRPSCANRPHMSKDFRWQAIQRVKTQDGVLSLGHFNLLKKLGCGDIGTVYLSELIGSNCLFAIKVMDNEFLERRKKIARAQTEREILRMLDHPFLPTLYAQFTSDNLSCLVMEYCPGGDLHVLRQKQFCRCFPEPAARFYVAEVLLALEYLHMLGVIYRDLKPENILVREDGHIMLTDFDLSLRCSVNPTLLKSPSSDPEPGRMSGPCTETHCMEPFCVGSSCQVTCFGPRFLPAAAKARKIKAEAAVQVRALPQLVAEPTDARSNSFVGTHEYLAPEIIKGEGHGAAVDWWTFGVFLYELLYGITPFKGHGNEETLANVVSQSLRFPDSPLVSFQARDLIRGLLVKEPDNRLGSEKGAAEIKQHPFFEGLNWALIRCAIPPELPESYDFEVVNSAHHENSKYLDLKANTEHLEFELF